MKVEVIEKGVYSATGKTDEPPKMVLVGTVLDVQGDTLPDYLAGKVRVVGDDAGKDMQANEPDLEGLRAEFEKLTGEKPNANMKPENLIKKIEEAKAKLNQQ